MSCCRCKVNKAGKMDYSFYLLFHAPNGVKEETHNFMVVGDVWCKDNLKEILRAFLLRGWPTHFLKYPELTKSDGARLGSFLLLFLNKILIPQMKECFGTPLHTGMFGLVLAST